MNARRAARVGWSLAFLACAACDPFPDLSALRGTPTDASRADGAAEAGADARDASAEDAQPGFCASSTHDFCSDFDEGPLPAPWDSADPGASLGGNAKSPPSAVRFTLPASQSGKPGSVLAKSFGHAWTRTLVELDMNLAEQVWPASGGSLGLVQIEFNDVEFFVWILPDATLGVTAQTPSYAPQTGTYALAYGTWTHLRFTVDPRPPGSYDLAVNGASIVSATNLGVTEPPGAGVALRIGPEQWNPPAPAVDVAFDDVTLDFR